MSFETPRVSFETPRVSFETPMEFEHTPSLEEFAAIERAARFHYYEGQLMTVSFWEKAAAALPPHVRRRHARLFEAAEQYEPVLDFLVSACRYAGRPLATGFRGTAGALRAAASGLAEAARRLTLHR